MALNSGEQKVHFSTLSSTVCLSLTRKTNSTLELSHVPFHKFHCFETSWYLYFKLPFIIEQLGRALKPTIKGTTDTRHYVQVKNRFRVINSTLSQMRLLYVVSTQPSTLMPKWSLHHFTPLLKIFWLPPLLQDKDINLTFSLASMALQNLGPTHLCRSISSFSPCSSNTSSLDLPQHLAPQCTHHSFCLKWPLLSSLTNTFSVFSVNCFHTFHKFNHFSLLPQNFVHLLHL